MRTLIFVISILCANNLFGQIKDTIFYNSDWEIASKDSASYYRIVKKESLYIVNDYFISGKLQMKGFYKSLDPDVRHGEFIFYNEKGEVTEEARFKDGEYINQIICYDDKGELIKDIEFEDQLDKKPEFKGGKDAFDKHLVSSIVYPLIAQENGISGRVYLTFCIMKDGSVDNIRITRGVDKYIDEEAIRVVKSSPKWKAGYLNGKPIVVQYDYKINFRLE